MRKLVSISFFLLVFATGAFPQAKIYTKKALLQDFTEKTVKVVVSSESVMELSFVDEVKARWKASPYEFCTPEDYEALKENNNYYFLRLANDRGLVYLSLTKGGNPQDADTKARPVNVVDMAIGTEGELGGRALLLLGACVDIIQTYALENVENEVIGYSGLNKYNERNMEGMTVCVNEEMGDELLDAYAPNTLVYWSVAPLDPDPDVVCFHILISTETREIYMYCKNRYACPEDARMSSREHKKIQKRGGIFME